MRPWAAWVALLALPALAGAQSLGDVARKERERREKVRETQPSAKTLTDEDLASHKGAIANDSEAPAEETAEGEGGEPARPTANEPPPHGAGREAAPPARGEDYWRGRLAEARIRVARAQQHYDFLQLQIGIGQPVRLDENGRRVMYSIYQMKEKADAAEVELRAAEKALEDLLEEGRKAGAQPGWLR